jgi:hypothetical protein
VGSRPGAGAAGEDEGLLADRAERPPVDRPGPPRGEQSVKANEQVAAAETVGDPGSEEQRPAKGGSFPRRSGPGGGPGDERESERGLRGLVGSGSSQVGVGAALRARDAARPSEAELADADANLVIVRRNWTPREELPRR